MKQSDQNRWYQRESPPYWLFVLEYYPPLLEHRWSLEQKWSRLCGLCPMMMELPQIRQNVDRAVRPANKIYFECLIRSDACYKSTIHIKVNHHFCFFCWKSIPMRVPLLRGNKSTFVSVCRNQVRLRRSWNTAGRWSRSGRGGDQR